MRKEDTRSDRNSKKKGKGKKTHLPNSTWKPSLTQMKEAKLRHDRHAHEFCGKESKSTREVCVKIHQATSVYERNLGVKTASQPKILPISYQSCTDNSKENILTTTACRLTARTTRRKKYFDYFIFKIVDCGLIPSGTRRCALAQTIGNARGLDMNSSWSAESHPKDLRFHQHQQSDDPNSARGLDSNFASDRGCDSTTTTRLRHCRLRRAVYAAHDKS
jgi:hypothetical protein